VHYLLYWGVTYWLVQRRKLLLVLAANQKTLKMR
jgi:hypothetical protein